MSEVQYTTDITDKKKLIYEKSSLLTEKPMHHCPGCGHSTVHRLIAEVIEELNIQEQTIGVASVGCSAFIFDYIDLDFVAGPHGRAAAVATGVKRTRPDKYVFSYQGDGDLAAIGTSESVHACNRGENITIFFINNGLYGMTGGQMAPTTMEHMKSTTTPYGREIKQMGHPMKFTELAANLPGTYYVTRQAVHKANAVRKTKKAIRKAFENQTLEKGLSFVEIVSSCNSNWKMSPIEANQWMEENMFPFYPLGDIKVDGKIIKR
ncbi:MAG: thiamine pyrophosphate-dependent enzyme [Bacteroidota bacterium]